LAARRRGDTLVAMPGRILIVDDDPDLRRGIQIVLFNSGYQTLLAADGEEGLQLALAEKPDLIVTDVMMPRRDGWSLVRSLRSHSELSLTPVVFLTALDGQEDALRGYTLGADDFLTKPINLTALPLRIGAALERRRQLDDLLRRGKASGTHAGGPRLTGTLSLVGLPSLLGLLEMEKKTGVLQIQRPRGDTARLFLRDGRVIDAELEPAARLPPQFVAYHVLSWTEGEFEFDGRPFEREERFHATTTHMLMEAARLQDEAKSGG
jgi:two-component system OmpR family response regulator